MGTDCAPVSRVRPRATSGDQGLLSTLTHRTAVLADAPEIHRLSAHLGYPPLCLSQTQTQLQSLLDSPTDAVYLALAESHTSSLSSLSDTKTRAVGWLHCFAARRLASAAFYEIAGLVVDPTARQQGVGKALVYHAMQQHPGPWRVRCNTQRSVAQLFYTAIGFDVDKTQRVLRAESKPSQSPS